MAALRITSQIASIILDARLKVLNTATHIAIIITKVMIVMVTAMVAGVIMPLLLEVVVKEQAYNIIFYNIATIVYW